MMIQPDMKSTLDGLADVVDVTLYDTQGSKFGRTLESFVDGMSSLAPGKIRVSRDRNDSGLPARPCFRIGRQGGASIVYAALPHGLQLPPFLNALKLISGGERPVSESGHESISRPAEIEVVISENCPHCPKAVDAAIAAAKRNPFLSLHIIDAGQFPDIVLKFRFRSTPATIVDRRLVLVGNTTADRLLELVEMRGTPRFEMEVMLSLIELRRIAEAADCIVQNEGRQVLLTLVQDLDMAKRLSALVVIEKALEAHPDVVRSMAQSFADLLSHRDARIRGDVADLLGKIGDLTTIPRLQPLTKDPDPDVAEIAAEAIEALRKRSC